MFIAFVGKAVNKTGREVSIFQTHPAGYAYDVNECIGSEFKPFLTTYRPLEDVFKVLASKGFTKLGL